MRVIFILAVILAAAVPPPCASADTAPLSLAGVPCGMRRVSTSPNTRVKGGSEAYRGQFPWSASLRHLGAHLCMGAVLTTRTVLTAAHCLGGRPAGQFSILAGAHNLTASEDTEPGRRAVAIKRAVVHPDYVEGRFEHDIALLQLAEPLSWGDYIQPACLPPANTDVKRLSGRRGLLAGWGYLDEWRAGGQQSDTLQWTALPLIAPATCQEWFAEAGRVLKLREGRLCAGYKEGGRDSCQADSGAPLTVTVSSSSDKSEDGGEDGVDGDREERALVAGVVSAGIGCGRPGLPGIYTDVSHYRKWIIEHVKALDPAAPTDV